MAIITKVPGLVVDETSNFTFANANVTGNLTASNISATNIIGTLTTSVQPNITSVGTLIDVSVTGNVTAGNLRTDNLQYANGAAYSFSGGASVSGSNTQIQFNTNGSFSASANLTFSTVTNTLTVDKIIADGVGLSNITAANVVGTVANATFATTANTVTTAAQPNITSVGTLTALTVDASITATSANLGNAVTANFFIGSGGNLGNLQGSNVVGTVANATYAATAGTATSADSAVTAGTVTTNAQPNITSIGTLSSLSVNGTVTATSANLGNAVTANFFIGSGNNLSNIQASNITGTVANANFATTASTVTTNAQPNITSVGTLSSLNVSGTVNLSSASNLYIAGGNANFVLSTDGAGNLSWVEQTTAGAGLAILPDVAVQSFTANGTANTFTLTTTPANKSFASVHIDGVYQTSNTWALTGNVVSFVDAPYANSIVEVTTLIQGSTATAGTAATVTASAQSNITSVGTLANLTVSGNTVLHDVSVTGNIIPTANIAYDLGNATNRFRDLYLSSNTLYLGNTTISANDILPIDLAILPEVLAIQIAAPQAGNDITWLFTWDTSTLPFARTAIVNSPQPSVPLYSQGTYQVNNFANEQTGVMTQRHGAYFKWIDGSGIENLVSWAENVGNVVMSNPNINDGADTTVQRININVPSTITIPTLVAPNVAYNVSFANVGAYTIGGGGVGDNRNIGPIYRGGTYTFNLASSLANHPFYLTTDNGTNFVANTYVGEYTSGVTGSRGNGQAGYTTLTFVVPQDAPDTLFYQCAVHASMRGAITIKDLAVETNVNGNPVIYLQHRLEGHKTPIELRPLPSLVNQMCVVYDQSTGKFVPQDLATYVENTPSFKNKIREVAGTATLVAADGVIVVPTVKIVEDASYLPLVGNKDGDITYAEDTETLYIWANNTWTSTKGTSGSGSGNAITSGNTSVAINTEGTVNITGNLIPTANVTYNLGSATNRFKDLFLSGNTIQIGNASLSASANVIALPSGSTIGGSGIISSFGKTYYWKGGLTENVSTMRFYIYTDSKLTAINTNLGTAGLTQSTAIVKKNGTTINTITIPANTTSVNQTVNIALAAGDYLTVDITQSSSASDMYVNFIYTG